MPELHTESLPDTNGPEASFSFFLPPKLQLGKYKIEKVMGQGGFGITYLATNTETNKQVVIKENFSTEFSYRNMKDLTVSPLAPEMRETYEKVLRRFMEEAQLLAALNHPNIVPVTTAFKALGTAYYVMPHINGKDLKKSDLTPSNITNTWLLPVLKKILLALKYLHGEGLIHRDIKPENILLQSDGEPMLIDFGTARNQQCTHTMTRMCTPGYTPFEQISPRGNIGPWTDFYALGATCYYLITGECPPESMDRMLKDSYIPLAKRPELRHRFPIHVLRSIDKALSLHPEQRWQRADEWISTLETDIEPLTLAPAEEQPIQLSPADKSLQPPKTHEQSGWKKFRIILTIFFILSSLAAAGYFIRTALPTTEQENSPTPPADDTAPITDPQIEQPTTETSSSALTPEAAVEKLRELGIQPSEYSRAICAAAEQGKLEQLRYLITAGADVNTSINNLNTPLHLAVIHKHNACVRILLAAENIQPDAANSEGKTPLMMACTNGNSESTELLIATGKVNPNTSDNQGNYPLTVASFYDYTACVQQLVKAPGIDVNIFASNGETALQKAVVRANNQVVQALLKAPGVDVNLGDKAHDNTPLIIAAAAGNTECIRQLLAFPELDINKSNNKGLTPVIAACISGKAETLRLLLERQNINVNSHTNEGLSPLIAAITFDHIECLKLLLNKPNIEVNNVGPQGHSPLLTATATGKTECLRALLKVPGINVNNKNRGGITALHAAAAAPQYEALKILLAHPDIDVNATGDNGQTALQIAAAKKAADCVRALLAHPDININAAANEGQTALHIAISKGATECVRILLAQPGINVNSRLSNGMTPLDLAEYHKLSECARLIRAAGGN